MNIIAITLSIIVAAIPVNEWPTTSHSDLENSCITAEKILKPAAKWGVLKAEVKLENKISLLEISGHNPLNKKTPESVDAKFILSMDNNSQKPNLVAAIYFNDKTTVTFKRIYSSQNITIKNKLKKFLLPTPCFTREVVPIIRLEPEIIEVPDGGTD